MTRIARPTLLTAFAGVLRAEKACRATPALMKSCHSGESANLCRRWGSRLLHCGR